MKIEKRLNNIPLYKKNYIELIKQIKSQIKPNPNKFLIIDKWNYKVYQKYHLQLFDLISKIMENYYQEYYNDDVFSHFADIKTFNLGDKV